MNIFILQKSIADLKSPVVRKPCSTQASTLREFICEMVAKNATAAAAPENRIELFDALTAGGSDRITYGREKRKFSVDEMQEFALQAFCDSVYLVRNATRGIAYDSLEQELQLSEGDEIALIKLKYVRGAIW